MMKGKEGEAKTLVKKGRHGEEAKGKERKGKGREGKKEVISGRRRTAVGLAEDVDALDGFDQGGSRGAEDDAEEGVHLEATSGQHVHRLLFDKLLSEIHVILHIQLLCVDLHHHVEGALGLGRTETFDALEHLKGNIAVGSELGVDVVTIGLGSVCEEGRDNGLGERVGTENHLGKLHKTLFDLLEGAGTIVADHPSHTPPRTHELLGDSSERQDRHWSTLCRDRCVRHVI
mmetsp:Transcript_49940/g.82888  ORF Transcript_49940/g.82888 Transcript_49940/m.82888 type:complete len:231 (+) Transcript_49940:2-694(+)